MTLFVRRIPDHATVDELKSFVESGIPAIAKIAFWKRPKIVEARILTIFDAEAGEIERHGLVAFERFRFFGKMAERLNGQRFKGRRVAVRRYVERFENSDRRVGGGEGILFEERRLADRRRPGLEFLDGVVGFPSRARADRGAVPLFGGTAVAWPPSWRP